MKFIKIHVIVKKVLKMILDPSSIACLLRHYECYIDDFSYYTVYQYQIYHVSNVISNRFELTIIIYFS